MYLWLGRDGILAGLSLLLYACHSFEFFSLRLLTNFLACLKDKYCLFWFAIVFVPNQSLILIQPPFLYVLWGFVGILNGRFFEILKALHSFSLFSLRDQIKFLASSKGIQLNFESFSQTFTLNCSESSDSDNVSEIILNNSAPPDFSFEPSPKLLSLKYSMILSSFAARPLIIDKISLKLSLSISPVTSSYTTGSMTYPQSLPSFFLKALPRACTISTLLFLGSANTIQSMFGTSTPSVKHLALVINAFGDLANSWTISLRLVVGILPETV